MSVIGTVIGIGEIDTGVGVIGLSSERTPVMILACTYINRRIQRCEDSQWRQRLA